MKRNIILAGGCFWGVDVYYSNLKGVLETSSGYANGNFLNPTYEQVCNNEATHAEAVNISYDTDLISLDKILDHYFRIIDPFTLNKQGNDVGIQYRTGIYYTTDEDYEQITTYLERLQRKLDQKIVVEVVKLTNYSMAEDYHQEYLLKNPNGYCHIDLNLLKDDERK